MQEATFFENPLSIYLAKQRKFKSLVKSVQRSLKSKEYKQQGYSFDEFIKKKWNISKAQAYRYLISAKVIDQLEEFDIQPSYERLCRSLYNYAKTPQQMKLLWGTILKRARSRPDCINSSHVTKIWKELYMDEKYSHICNYEKEIMDKVERSLNRYSRKMKLKQMGANGENVNMDDASYYSTPDSTPQNQTMNRSNNQYSPLMKDNRVQVLSYDNVNVNVNVNTPPNNNGIVTNMNGYNTAPYPYAPTPNNQQGNSHIPSPVITVSIDQYGNNITSYNNVPMNTPLSPVSNCSPIGYDDPSNLKSSAPVAAAAAPQNTYNPTNVNVNVPTTTIIYQQPTGPQPPMNPATLTPSQNNCAPAAAPAPANNTNVPPPPPPAYQYTSAPANVNAANPTNTTTTTTTTTNTNNNTPVQYQYNQPNPQPVQYQYGVPAPAAPQNNGANTATVAAPTTANNNIQYQAPAAPQQQYQYSQPIMNSQQQTIIYYKPMEQPANNIVINNNNGNNFYYTN